MTKSNSVKVDIEHIKLLTGIFQEVRTEGYMHDYDGDYKIIGMALKRTKEYEIEVLKDLLDYFKKHGLKEVDKMQGFLIWAFKNPKTAKQPYNTIDLQNNKGRGVTNERRKVIQPNERSYYDEIFERINGNAQ